MNNVDQKARDMANDAISMLKTHERVCIEQAKAAQQWREGTTQQIAEGLAGVKKSIGDVYNRLWVAATGLVVVLLACCGYLIAHHGL
jgi:putative component of toxin-antitoxin plasmid stabilization module